MKLNNHIAIITGGARGIGFGCALELAKEGASIVLSDRPGSAELAGAADAIRALGGRCLAVEADAFSREGCEAIMAAALAEFGDVDALVSVPAYNRRASFLDYEGEVFEGILKSALLGSFHMSQLVCRHFVARKKPGKVVFISSVLARVPNARCVAYSAAKAANINFAQCLAKDLAPFGVRVNSVCPGMVQTPLNRAVWQAWWDQAPEAERLGYDDWAAEKIRKIVPLGRWQTPESIADMLLFLASARAAHVTGQTINVDGGFVMHW